MSFAANAQSGRCEDNGAHFVVERVAQYIGDVQRRRKTGACHCCFPGLAIRTSKRIVRLRDGSSDGGLRSGRCIPVRARRVR